MRCLLMPSVGLGIILIQCHWLLHKQDKTRKCAAYDNPYNLAGTKMVSPNDDLCTCATPDSIHLPYTNKKPPTTQDTAADGMSAVRKSLERRGISQCAVNIIMSSWRKSTQSQYLY